MMDTLRHVEDVQELDYAQALEDQKDLDAAWAVIEESMRKSGDEEWSIASDKRQVYRQREISSCWNRLMIMARRQEVEVPIPYWMEAEND